MAMTAQEILQDEVKNNPKGYELFFNYDDKLASGTVAEAFQGYLDVIEEAKKNGTEPDYTSFETYLEDYVYEKWNLWEAIDDQIWSDFGYNRTPEEAVIVNKYLEQEGISLGEALDNEGFAGVSWSIKDIMSNYHMNLMFATPNEQNQDMGSIPNMFYDVQELDSELQKMKPKEQEQHFDNALSYLVHQQGYQMSQVAEVLYTGEPTTDEFLQSVVDELDGYATSWSMMELTALVTLDSDGLDVLDQIAKGEGTIKLSENTMIGLFNEWQGAGGSLEVELHKPFVVPADMVRNVQIEGQRSDSVYGYTVNDVYGLVGKAWEGTIETTDEPSGEEAIRESMKNNVEMIVDIIGMKAAEAEKNDRDMDD